MIIAGFKFGLLLAKLIKKVFIVAVSTVLEIHHATGIPAQISRDEYRALYVTAKSQKLGQRLSKNS